MFDDSVGAGGLTEQLLRLQQDIQQKDELISALVGELENAVEKLDRIERTGADRSHATTQPSAGVSSLFKSSDIPSGAVGDLQRMAAQWDESQPGEALARIESQLAAVHDLMLNLQRGDVIPRSDVASRADIAPRSDVAPQANETDFEARLRHLNQIANSSQAAPNPTPTPATASQSGITIDDEDDDDGFDPNMTIDAASVSWDAIKKQILGEDNSLTTTQAKIEDAEIIEDVCDTPPPKDIDFVNATIDQLKNAITERDEYIIQVNRLYRSRNSFALPSDWAKLGSVPGEMQVRVETLIERLDVQVRLGEVEMSLERARLARERSQIQAERETIQKHLRRLGISSLADLDSISAAPGTASDRRWMRFLGPNTR